MKLFFKNTIPFFVKEDLSITEFLYSLLIMYHGMEEYGTGKMNVYLLTEMVYIIDNRHYCYIILSWIFGRKHINEGTYLLKALFMCLY